MCHAFAAAPGAGGGRSDHLAGLPGGLELETRLIRLRALQQPPSPEPAEPMFTIDWSPPLRWRGHAYVQLSW